MRSRSALLAAVVVATAALATACIPGRSSTAAYASPATARMQAPLSPSAALRAAAGELRRAGFYVTAIDTVGSRLRAESGEDALARERMIECVALPEDARSDALPPTMIVEVAATPGGAGSAGRAGADLTVVTYVRTSYMRMTSKSRRPDSETECRSNGVVERRLAGLLNARTP
jgi:hypothetical protein